MKLGVVVVNLLEFVWNKPRPILWVLVMSSNQNLSKSVFHMTKCMHKASGQ